MIESLLTIDDVCTTLGVSKTTFWRWRTAQKIPYYMINKSQRFKESDIQKALEKSYKPQ